MQIEETAGTPNKFIVLRQEVLYDKNLSKTDKFVYARIATFDEYFESAESCAEVLGLSKRQVEDAKRRLEKAGYIKCLANTGHGKRYKAVYDIPKSVGQTYRKMQSRPTENCRSDLQKTVDIDKTLEKNIEKNNSIKDTKVSLIGDTANYGDPSVNEMFNLWQATFGFPSPNTKLNRRACYNLLRRKDLGREKLIIIIKLLAEAQQDRYTPKEIRCIVGFASLQSNLPHLMMWARRKYAQNNSQENVEL